MSRLLLLFCVAILSVYSTVARPSEPDWKLQVELVDGSRIVGSPTKQSLQIDIGFDEISLPLQRIHRAEWREKDAMVRVELSNRDRVTGIVRAEPLGMRTLFGDVTLDMNHFKSLEVIPVNRLGWLPSLQGLVLYYSFDQHRNERASNRVTNQVGDFLHGKADKIIWLDDGRRGGAVEFDGMASIEVPHDARLCPSKITFAMWVHPTSSDTGYQWLAAKTDVGSWHNGYGFVKSSGQAGALRFFVNNYSRPAVKTELPSGKWSHLAGVFDGNKVSVYVNGKQVGSTAIGLASNFGDPFGAPAPAPAANPFGGGRRVPGPATAAEASIRHSNGSLWIGRASSSYNWKGKVDEIVIYQRALTTEEIVQLYRAGGGE